MLLCQLAQITIFEIFQFAIEVYFISSDTNVFVMVLVDYNNLV